MKVSIITVSYQAADVISNCLDSVEKQRSELPDNFSLEHIVIDGASTDGTTEIAESHPSVDVVISESDLGLYDAMNKGLSVAEGEIIAFLNSDDWYIDSKVISDVIKLFNNTKSDAVFGDLVYVDPKNEKKIIRKWKAGPKGNFKLGWMPPHPSIFVKKTVFDRFGGFNISLRFSADYEWMVRALYAQALKMTYLPRTLVVMRAGGLSNASLSNRMEAHFEDHKAWKMNDLHPYPWTVLLKPLRKVLQFLK